MTLCEKTSIRTSQVPIVVDIDGLLLRTRAADETFLEALLSAPWRAARLAGTAVSGDGAAREGAPSFDVEHWPSNEDFAGYLESEARSGREIVLATAANESISSAIVRKFPFIRRVVRLAPGTMGDEKARVLRALFPDGFAYAGQTSDDLAVWKHAKDAIAVNAPASVLQKLGAIGPMPRVYSEHQFSLRTLRRALRLHQWAKNLLIFVPLVLGGKVLDPHAWLNAVIGVLALGLVASATYIINDFIDLPNDRQHRTKRFRPLAAGEMSSRSGLLLMLACLAGGFGLAIVEGGHALGMISLYLVITLAYSLWLKKIPILDVTALSTLYTLRLGLGIVLAQVSVSSWLLVFSMFVFLSLSLAKRYTEVLLMKDTASGRISGRGYLRGDAPFILSLGAASTVASVLIMALFLSEDVFNRPQYVEPHLLWACPPILLLFLGRIWLLSQRGEMHDDPVAFALKDRVSLLLGGLMAVLLALALTGPKIW